MKKNFTIRLVCLLLATLLLLSFASCAGSNDAKSKTAAIPERISLTQTDVLKGKKIGCTTVSMSDEWCAGVHDAMLAIAEYYGVEITVEDGDLNDETQTKQLENMISDKVDMIFVDPVTPDGSDAALCKAVDAGIPIIVYDCYWNGADKAVTTVNWNQYQSGVMTAEYFLDYIRANCNGKATIVELETVISTHCRQRFDGFHDTIDKASDCEITILNHQDSQGNREIANNILLSVAEPFDFVLSDIDNGAMGACAALTAMGKEAKVLSMGGYGEESFTKLHEQDAHYLAGLTVDPWTLVQNVFESAIKYFSGEEQPALLEIPIYMVDSENVTEFWNFD